MPRRRTRKTPVKKSAPNKNSNIKDEEVDMASDEEEITTLDEISNSQSKNDMDSFDQENSVDDNDSKNMNDDEDEDSKDQIEHDDELNNQERPSDSEDMKDEYDRDDGEIDIKEEVESPAKYSKDNSSSSKRENSKHDSSSNKEKHNANRKSDQNHSKKSSRNSSESDSNKKDSSKKEKDKDYDESYFRRMHHRSQDKFHDPTDKELFIDNLWNNVKDKDIMKLCQHRYSSSCISFLVENLENMSTLKKLIDRINPEQFTVDFVTKEDGRSVCESIIDVFMKKLSKDENFETETNKWIIKWFDSAAKFLTDNLDSFMNDLTENGNNFFIMMLEVLGGMRIGRYWSRKNMKLGGGQILDIAAIVSNDKAIKEIPPSFKHHLKKITKQLVLDVQENDVIREKMFKECHSVSQYLLFVLRIRYPELCQMAVKRLVEAIFENDETRDSICHQTNGAYIVELILLVASESRLSKIWTKHLKSQLKQFWKHDISQFIIQRLIDAIREENLYSDVVQGLFPDLGELFKCNRPGIGVCLAKTCKNFPKMQAPMMSAILKAFDCQDKDKQIDIVPSMLFFESKFQKPSNRGGYPLWLYGSLMLQHMFNFDDPYKISKSLIAMSLTNLMRTCQDRSGSHVIDCFIKSTTVELKHKSELVEKLLGRYAELSCDKFGSRIVENIMNQSNDEVKATILRELSQKESSLMKNRNGWFVAKNTGLSHFKNRPNDWREVEHNRMKRKREFNEYIPNKHRSFGPGSRGGSNRGDDFHRGRFNGGSRGRRGRF